jgi:hypothetical protein
MKSLWLMSAMIVAAPALAQTATPPASTNAAQPAATAQPAPQPTTDAPAAQATPSAQPTPSAPAAADAAPANPADAVAAVVSNDWAKYDANNDSNLSKDEFAKWMTALRESNPAQKAQVKDVNAWTTAAFAQADKDKSGAVSKDELQGFLKG